MLNPQEVKKDFPIFDRKIRGKPLIYLDNAATTQKPRTVIEALDNFYRKHNANIHRGIHTLSEESTALFEETRRKTAEFIGAPDLHEVIFTRNCTEAINVVSFGWGRKFLKSGDEIIISEMEHHSNIVPWQILAQATGAVLKFINVTEAGQLDMAHFEKLLTNKTKIVSITAMSNVLGTITPVEEIVKKAHAKRAIVLVDAAQAVPHFAVDVQKWNCDFLAFSAHKMAGPTGLGVLWGRRELLEAMDPFISGGDMILEVTKETTRFNEIPWKFEAGTPSVADVIAFGAAVDYLNKVGMAAIREHEINLTRYALAELSKIDGLTLFGPRDLETRGAAFSFNLGNIHPHDVGTLLDREGIAVRSGHHCCQPLMQKLGIWGTVRASFYIYNDKSDVDALIVALKKVIDFFSAKRPAGAGRHPPEVPDEGESEKERPMGAARGGDPRKSLTRDDTVPLASLSRRERSLGRAQPGVL